jgi:uncharacterized tellurite resistance protein B-like protein
MSQDQRLDDLAVLYVGLAHGLDGRMHFNEFTQIADHLVRWRHPGDRRDVLELVDAAVVSHSSEQVSDAIQRLARTMSDRERSEVMEDLSEIALADRRFLRDEALYIVRVAESWGIRTQSGSQEGAFSSVMRASAAGL